MAKFEPRFIKHLRRIVSGVDNRNFAARGCSASTSISVVGNVLNCLSLAEVGNLLYKRGMRARKIWSVRP